MCIWRVLFCNFFLNCFALECLDLIRKAGQHPRDVTSRVPREDREDRPGGVNRPSTLPRKVSGGHEGAVSLGWGAMPCAQSGKMAGGAAA